MTNLPNLVYYAGIIYVILPIAFLVGLAVFFLFGKRMSAETTDRWITFSKWYMTSVAIVFAASIITNSFTERETGIKEMQVYDKYVQHILEADNIELRIKLAQYFATVTPTERLRDRWEEYHNTLIQEKEAYQNILKMEKELIKDSSNNLPKEANYEMIAQQKAVYEQPLLAPKNNLMRVDFFFLEGNQAAESKALRYSQLLDRSYYKVRVRMLSTAKNSEPGYRITENQIRSEASELPEASAIREVIGEEISIITISYNTPGYLSVFIVN